MKEADLQRAVLDWLQLNNYCHWRAYTGPVVRGKPGATRFSKNPAAGFPDICVISKMRPGRLMTFELKTKTGRLRPEQLMWAERLFEAGVPHYTVRTPEMFIGALRLAEESW